MLNRDYIGVGHADIGRKEKAYVRDVLNRAWISTGPVMDQFEKTFAKLHGRRYGIMSNSGTSSLQIAVACLKETGDWKEGDEVLVPAVTFVATSNVVIQNGLRPVFVDAEPHTYNMDPAQIERHLTSRTRAIIVAHLCGLPTDMDPIISIARRHHLKIIEDSCETMFVPYRGRPVGSFGDIACFSTYVAHLIVTGVGGLAITNRERYAIVMRSLMNHGRDAFFIGGRDAIQVNPRRYQGKHHRELSKIIDRRFRFVRMGFSYRATELEAALGMAQLERHQKILARRQANARYLIKGLKPYESLIQLPSCPPDRGHAFMMFPIIVCDPRIRRKDLLVHLESHQIETRELLPLLNQPVYREMFGDLEDRYPVARWIGRRGFYVGCHPHLKKRDLDRMIRVFSDFLDTYRRK